MLSLPGSQVTALCHMIRKQVEEAETRCRGHILCCILFTLLYFFSFTLVFLHVFNMTVIVFIRDFFNSLDCSVSVALNGNYINEFMQQAKQKRTKSPQTPI